MTITKAEVLAFLDKIEDKIENDAEKGLQLALSFLRSTASALAKDPVLTAALQAGFAGAVSGVAAAVETGGASVLAGAALGAARSLVISVGGTAEHELVPIVAGEIHASLAAATAATPEHANP